MLAQQLHNRTGSLDYTHVGQGLALSRSNSQWSNSTNSSGARTLIIQPSKTGFYLFFHEVAFWLISASFRQVILNQVNGGQHGSNLHAKKQPAALEPLAFYMSPIAGRPSWQLKGPQSHQLLTILSERSCGKTTCSPCFITCTPHPSGHVSSGHHLLASIPNGFFQKFPLSAFYRPHWGLWHETWYLALLCFVCPCRISFLPESSRNKGWNIFMFFLCYFLNCTLRHLLSESFHLRKIQTLFLWKDKDCDVKWCENKSSSTVLLKVSPCLLEDQMIPMKNNWTWLLDTHKILYSIFIEGNKVISKKGLTLACQDIWFVKYCLLNTLKSSQEWKKL